MDDQFADAADGETRPKSRPWLFRTYSGHSSAKASNALYRTNLERGQTGLSIAFDLPTQTGHDSDHHLARGEVGKVGVPICHLGDMRALFDSIPLEQMNTSMTINAPAAWLLALYVAVAEEQGADRMALAGTVQNDIFKEYLARGTYIFPPRPSLRLTTDVIAFTGAEMPMWNPVNVCSYHLQEAGATPAQEMAFALAAAIGILDALRDGGDVDPADFPHIVGRISFFLNAGIRFVTETCKVRAFTQLWDEITAERYGVEDPKLRRFRYGVQVNSLGLTEQQPENNVYRILLETLAVVLSKDARARSVQLPAWNEALGLPRPWDQQWSLRLQQILAYETDLLEFDDIFEGSTVIAETVERLKTQALEEMARVEAEGGIVEAIESSTIKRRLVESNAARLAAIEAGDQVVIGVNKYTEGEESPLVGDEASFLTIDPADEAAQVKALAGWRADRDDAAVATALGDLEAAAGNGRNIMPLSIACARVGVTTGEWADALRRVFGEYRAPTGISAATAPPASLAAVRERVEALKADLGRPPRLLMGKPGLDGHSSGAEQVAVRARDAGFEVIYDGLRLTPDQIVEAAVQEGVDVVGLSILSGSHLQLAADVAAGLKAADMADVPLIIGGIIPPKDADTLRDRGIARIYTPSDYDVTAIVDDIVGLVEDSATA